MTTLPIQNLFLTLDFTRPFSNEHVWACQLLNWLSVELSDFDLKIELIMKTPPTFPQESDPHGWPDPTEWAKHSHAPSLIKTYDELSGYRLVPGSLLIGVDLPSALQNELSQRRVPWINVRQIPHTYHEWILLIKANFPLPEKWTTSLPTVSSHIPNQYQFPPNSAGFISTSCFHPDRILNGSAIYIRYHFDEILSILRKFPNVYYCVLRDHDKNEMDFLSSFGTVPVNVPLLHLLTSPEIKHLFSIDSSIAPLASAYGKPFTRLASLPHVDWSPVALRWFRTKEFMSDLCEHALTWAK